MAADRIFPGGLSKHSRFSRRAGIGRRRGTFLYMWQRLSRITIKPTGYRHDGQAARHGGAIGRCNTGYTFGGAACESLDCSKTHTAYVPFCKPFSNQGCA